MEFKLDFANSRILGKQSSESIQLSRRAWRSGLGHGALPRNFLVHLLPLRMQGGQADGQGGIFHWHISHSGEGLKSIAAVG